MDFDISNVLDHWDYKPGCVVVRKFNGNDGKEKIQLRVDLGLLQMNAEGRPDGKQPFGHPSLLEFYQAKLSKHTASAGENAEEFKLTPEDCARLQLEALQYHHRYICLLQLNDYAGVIRDTERNLSVFNFVGEHAETEELGWSLRQFQPQLLMIRTRARAMKSLDDGNFAEGIEQIERGIEEIREFYRENGRGEFAEQSGELQSLEAWLGEVRANRPLSAREKLEQALSDAVQSEDYEKAAKVREAIRKLEEK
jgi:hypothetical protein